MTEPKQIADALVEAGIVARHSKEGLLLGQSYNVRPSVLVNDWRVAGKCLEDWSFSIEDRVSYYENYERMVDTTWLRDPRAIIEAWYAATRQDND